MRPSREAVTTFSHVARLSRSEYLTNSGMIAPASVPQVMTVESFHHSELSPPQVRDHEAGKGHRSLQPRDDRGQQTDW